MKLVGLFSFLMVVHCAIGENETTTTSIEYCLANVVEDCRENCFVWCEGENVVVYPDAVPWYCYCDNNRTSIYDASDASGGNATASSSNALSLYATGLAILEILLNFILL
ncbi:hypothetical protein TKK_0014124 [Trichogramma kaykai]